MEANTPPEPSNSTWLKKGSDIQRTFHTHPCRMEWQNESIRPSKRGWRQCSSTPDWSWNSGPKHCRWEYIWSIFRRQKKSSSKCHKHCGKGRNRPTIDFVYSDVKPTHSSHGRKGPNWHPNATKCIFFGYGIDGEFSYRLWDPENRKLIRSSDVLFNEDSILSWNQQKIMGKNVYFKIATDDVEEPTHRTELAFRQTAKENML